MQKTKEAGNWGWTEEDGPLINYTVEQLIKELSKHPQDRPVRIFYRHGETFLGITKIEFDPLEVFPEGDSLGDQLVIDVDLPEDEKD